jgi:hypothetical protein
VATRADTKARAAEDSDRAEDALKEEVVAAGATEAVMAAEAKAGEMAEVVAVKVKVRGMTVGCTFRMTALRDAVIIINTTSIA